jgi:hypothetical protein
MKGMSVGRMLLAVGVTLAVCTLAANSRVKGDAAKTASDSAPRGAITTPSGYATVLRAPSPPYPTAPPPPEDHPTSEAGWYARSQGISEAEAKKRLLEQEVIRPEFERLLATLHKHEAGNFTAPRLIHEPDWAYVFYFKREPAATLAKYSDHPRFRAALARYTQAELDALMQPWARRFEQARIFGASSSDDTFGTAEFTLSVTRKEYERLAAREKWRVPDPIVLSFAPELKGPAVDPRVASFVRIFPQSDRSSTIVLLSATLGRIVLEDGCLRVTRPREPPALAYFAREAGLTLDDEGYLALRDRTSQSHAAQRMGRIGEVFVWEGYGEVTDTMAMVPELRARCGAGPIVHVGSPTSLHHFRVRPFAIDAYAESKGMSRQAAWNEIKACWQRQDARPQTAWSLDLDCDSAPQPSPPD